VSHPRTWKDACSLALSADLAPVGLFEDVSKRRTFRDAVVRRKNAETS
jgi:hypothetical protein